MPKPVHKCGYCGAPGTVPEQLLWDWIAGAAFARCAPECPVTKQQKLTAEEIEGLRGVLANALRGNAT